jgi:general secretion pathway protein D
MMTNTKLATDSPRLFSRPLALCLAALVCFSLSMPALAGGGGGGGGGRGGGGGGAGGGGFGGGGGGGTGSSSSTTANYPAQGQIGSMQYTIDPISGAIVYFTTEANNSNVLKVLNGLDRPKPQALIKCVFLEVTYNNGLDVGVEGGLTHALNGSQILSYSNLFGLAAQGITPTAGVNTLAGASLLTLTGDNFSVLLRAIQEKGKVNVLSRPTILARQAQPAQILIGQEVPIVTGVTFNSYGQETSSVSYTPVGIVLNVTPFIYPNGDVEMILYPQISEVSSQSTQISGGTNGNFSTPYINSRSANTVVVCPSGQTIVIGGLMQDTKSTTSSGIPVLQSIPLLGNMFKHKQTAISKTELMIFITPTVIKTHEELAAMSQDEVSRTSLSKKAFSQKEKDIYIDPKSPVPFPGAAAAEVQEVPSPRRQP